LRLPARCCSASMAVSGPLPPAGAGAASAADSLRRAPFGSGCAGSLSYYRLASQLAAIEAEPSRLGKESLMRELLCEGWAAGEEQLVACAALTTLQLEAGAKPAKLGMGTAALLEAIVYATNAADCPDASELQAGAGPAADLVGPRPAKSKITVGAAGEVPEESAAENRPAPARASRLRADLRVLGDIGLLASQELTALRKDSGTRREGAGGGGQKDSGGGREVGGAAVWSAEGEADNGEAGGREPGVGSGAGPGVDVLEVLSAMRALAAAGGEGAQERKPRMLADLLGRMSPLEGKMVRFRCRFPFLLVRRPAASCPRQRPCPIRLTLSNPALLSPAASVDCRQAAHRFGRLLVTLRLRPGRAAPSTRRRFTDLRCARAGRDNTGGVSRRAAGRAGGAAPRGSVTGVC
jgi:hypothetical protein